MLTIFQKIKFKKGNALILLIFLILGFFSLREIEEQLENILQSRQIISCFDDPFNKQIYPEELTGHIYLVNQVAITEDSRFMASASHDEIRVWKLNDKQNYEDKIKIILGKNNQRNISDSPKNTESKRIVLGTITTVDIANNENDIIIAAWGWGNQKLSVWKIDLDKLEKTNIKIREKPDKISDKYDYNVKSISISPNQKYIATGSNQEIKIWEITDDKNLKLKAILIDEIQGYVKALSFSNNGKTLVSGDSSGKLQIWNWENQRLESETSDKNTNNAITALSISNNENIISGFDNGSAIWWQSFPRPSPKRRLKFYKNQNRITSLAISPNSNILAIGRFDGFVEVWDLDKSQRLQICQLPDVNSNQKIALSVANNSELKIIGYGFQVIKFWRM